MIWLATLAATVAGAGVLFLWLERRGRSAQVVLILVAVAVVDAALYPSSSANELSSFFNPEVVRLPQALIPLAVGTRIVGRGLPKRVEPVVLLWGLAFVWYTGSAVSAYFAGHETSFVLRQLAIVVYIGAMAFLVATLPIREFLVDSALPRFVHLTAILAGVLYLTDLAEFAYSGNLPLLPLEAAGIMGADVATAFATIGFLGLGVALARDRRRGALIASSLVLIASHLGTDQRAARIGVLASVIALVLVLIFLRSRGRMRVTGGEFLVVLLAVTLGLTGPLFLRAGTATGSLDMATVVPFVADTTEAFDTSQRYTSIQSRYNQWEIATDMIAERPLAGWHLGVRFYRWEEGTMEFYLSDLAHNVVLDILLRTGFVGLLLFLVAFGRTFADGLLAWRRAGSRAASALALMCVVGIVGLLAKGMVESVFEKYRLMVVLGLLVGLIASSVASVRAPQDARVDVDGAPDEPIVSARGLPSPSR